MARSGRQWILVALLAAAGLVVSAYLTVVHYSGGPLACATGGVLNCDLVTRSSFGMVAGTSIPTSLAGILWFAVVLVLAVTARRLPYRLVTVALGAWSAVGTVVVLYLVYVELVRLHHVCEWCTAVHVAVIAILLLSLALLQDAFAEGGEPGDA